jgi:hypothetical protein
MRICIVQSSRPGTANTKLYTFSAIAAEGEVLVIVVETYNISTTAIEACWSA